MRESLFYRAHYLQDSIRKTVIFDFTLVQYFKAILKERPGYTNT